MANTPSKIHWKYTVTADSLDKKNSEIHYSKKYSGRLHYKEEILLYFTRKQC